MVKQCLNGIMDHGKHLGEISSSQNLKMCIVSSIGSNRTHPPICGVGLDDVHIVNQMTRYSVIPKHTHDIPCMHHCPEIQGRNAGLRQLASAAMNLLDVQNCHIGSLKTVHVYNCNVLCTIIYLRTIKWAG